MEDEKVVERVNPLLSGVKKIPGIKVEIPTKGLLYTDELSGRVKESGEVMVSAMSIRNEMAMKTPDLLISGEGIEQLINDCVHECDNAWELFVCDINTLMVAVRIATFGEMMSVKVSNPHYDEKLKGSEATITYDVDLRNCLAGGGSIKSKDDLMCKLDNGQIVTLEPLRFNISMKLIKLEIDAANTKLETNEARMAFLKDKVKQLTKNALKMITSVTTEDGVVITDEEFIAEWYGSIKANAYEPLKEKMKLVEALGPDLMFEALDPVTKKTWKAKVPINPVDFFGIG